MEKKFLGLRINVENFKNVGRKRRKEEEGTKESLVGK